MNAKEALEIVETNVTPKSAIQIIDELGNCLKPIMTTQEYSIVRSALQRLEDIEKRAEEYINRLEEEKRKPYHMLLLGEDEVIKLIDHIIKGEGK